VKVNRVQEKPNRTFSILKLVLENGERLPCLVDAKTWEPTRVATRWAVRYRRYHVQSSTLASNLRILQRIYLWAETQGQFDLDDFLTSGQRLNTRQIESLIHYLRTKGQPVIAGVITPKNPELIDELRAAQKANRFLSSLDSAKLEGLTSDQSAELRRLREENDELRKVNQQLSKQNQELKAQSSLVVALERQIYKLTKEKNLLMKKIMLMNEGQTSALP
jgi:hypothetical protein